MLNFYISEWLVTLINNKFIYNNINFLQNTTEKQRHIDAPICKTIKLKNQYTYL